MYRMSAFPVVCVVGILLLFSTVSPAPASTIVLGELLDGGSITWGDKLFDQFGYAATGDMPDASDVNVTTIVDGDGNLGLRFQGAFVDLFGDGGSDALITYRVMTTLPGFLISDVHLAGNPFVAGSGAVVVTESFQPDDLSTMLGIFDIEPGGNTNPTDFAFLAVPLKTLNIQKDILSIASVEGSAATLSFVDQTFSQVAVPEPSTISLFILGLVAAWGLRRRLAHGG
jgi:PEP-CTERM motif